MGLVVNFGILAFIVYRTLQISDPTWMARILAVYAVLFFVPLGFSSFLSGHIRATALVIRVSQYLLYSYIAVLLLNLFVIPAIVFFGAIFLVVFSIGLAFSLYSHPHIMTHQTYEKIIDRNEAREERELIKEISSNEKQVNQDEN